MKKWFTEKMEFLSNMQSEQRKKPQITAGIICGVFTDIFLLLAIISGNLELFSTLFIVSLVVIFFLQMLFRRFSGWGMKGFMNYYLGTLIIGLVLFALYGFASGQGFKD